MASSGQFVANNTQYNCYMFINWQLAGQEVDNNRSLINWQAYFHFGGGDTQLDNGTVYSNAGTHWANGGRVYNFSGNYSVRDMGLASGSFWINHDSAGNGVLQFAIGITTQFSPSRSEGTSGIWSLPTIPRASQPSLVANPTVIGNNMVINMNRLSSSFTHVVKAYFGSWSKTLASGVATQYTWNTATDASDLYSQIPNNQSGIGTITVDTYNGGTYIGSKSVGFTVTVDPTTNKPVFTDFDYEDTNASTVAVTGDNQILIQGKSTLEATVAVADKMVPQNSATATNYTASIDGVVDTEAFSSVADVVFALGTVAGSGNRTLSVSAKDSRNLTNSVNKTINVLPYVSPDISIVAQRENNFENATTLDVSGTFSRLNNGTSDLNAIVAGSLEYRKRQDGGAWSSWVDLTWTQSTGTFEADTEYLSLDNGSVWDIEVRVTDALETVTESIQVGRGVPILFIADEEEKVGINKMPDTGGRKGLYLEVTDNLFNMVYPIGSIYMSVNSANPSTLFGGTWVAWGTGRVPVGVDTSQSEFNTVEETGGHKLMQSHTHGFRYAVQGSGGGVNNIYGMPYNASANGSVVTQSGEPSTSGELRNGVLTNGSGNAQNLQPYITCYMWKRTA